MNSFMVTSPTRCPRPSGHREIHDLALTKHLEQALFVPFSADDNHVSAVLFLAFLLWVK